MARRSFIVNRKKLVKPPKFLSQYPTYIIVGASVTLATVLIRSVIGLLIEDDTTAKYLSSIVLAYVIGIYLSFLGHKNITFKAKKHVSVSQIFKFIAVHLLGMTISLALSLGIRKLFLDAWLSNEFSKMFAFATSAFIVSIITYLLKKYIVFSSH